MSVVEVPAAEPAEGADTPKANRLSKLLEFLRTEVENEERINMAVHGFAVQTEGEKRERTKTSREKPSTSREIATASALLANEENKEKSIFCSNPHESNKCKEARKMSLDARKKIIKENGYCLKCVKKGHFSKNCDQKVTCGWCSYKHNILVWFSLPGNNTNKSLKNNVPDKSDKHVEEQALANFVGFPEVYLQTFKAILFSENDEKCVRVVVDNGSHRSYIRSAVAE